MVKEVPLCACICWGVVTLSASVFSACLSLLWICIMPTHNCARMCVCVSVRVAFRGLGWFCCAVSVTYWAGLVGVPWLRCAVFTLSIYSSKHSWIYYSSHSLPPFPLYLFFFSLFYISPWFPADFFWLAFSNRLLSSGGVSVDSQGWFPLCRGQDWVLYHSPWTRSLLYFYFHFLNKHKLWMKWLKEWRRTKLAHLKACLLRKTGMRHIYLKGFLPKTMQNAVLKA